MCITLAKVVKCDICGYVGEEKNFKSVGFHLKKVYASALFGIKGEFTQAQTERDLCNDCYSSLLKNFKHNPVDPIVGEDCIRPDDGGENEECPD